MASSSSPKPEDNPRLMAIVDAFKRTKYIEPGDLTRKTCHERRFLELFLKSGTRLSKHQLICKEITATEEVNDFLMYYEKEFLVECYEKFKKAPQYDTTNAIHNALISVYGNRTDLDLNCMAGILNEAYRGVEDYNSSDCFQKTMSVLFEKKKELRKESKKRNKQMKRKGGGKDTTIDTSYNRLSRISGDHHKILYKAFVSASRVGLG